MNSAQNKKIAFYFLLAEVTAALVFLFVKGRFAVQHSYDSITYLDFFPAATSPVEFLRIIFSNCRTFGYPLFLKLVSFWDPGYVSLPLIQYLLYAGVVLFFYRSLTAFGFGPWTAWGMSAPLLAGRLVLKYSAQIMSDSLALALAILCFAWGLRAAARPEKKISWAALGVTVFFCYQVRPVFTFLVFFFPIMIVFLHLLQTCEDSGDSRVQEPLRVFGRASVVCLGPLLFFCLFRFVVTGEKGVISYAGINASGVSAVLIQPEIVSKLPSDLVPLARAVLEERSQLGAKGIEGSRVRWKEHERWVTEYNDFVWDVNYKAAKRLLNAEASGVRHNLLNERLWAFFKALVRARPLVYAQLYFLSCQRFIMQTLYTHLWLQAVLSLWLLSLGMAGLFFRKKWEHAGTKIQSFFEKQAVLCALSLPFYILQMLSVLLIQVPQGRYYMAAEVFLPGFFLALAILPWEEFKTEMGHG